jgi:two-component system, OmpR family, phosphate regulon sensor histidine kinase PhoR
MKKRLNIIIAFIALVILIGAQFYVVSELYHLKNGEFNRSYGGEIFYGVETYQQQKELNPLAPVFEVMDKLASRLIFDYPGFELETDTIKSGIIRSFENLLIENDSITPFLEKYLEAKNLDSDISTFFIIKSLKLHDLSREFIIFDKTSGEDGLINNQDIGQGAIFIRSFNAKRDYFDIEIDFYVDFSNRIRIIVREMRFMLVLLTLTVVVVLLVYILTLRNMLRQKKLSELKSDFISNMTHELKTPLSTIAVASASLTLDNVLGNPEKSKNLSEIIKRQNKLLNQMIDQVLDISALEQSGFSIKKEPVEIKFLIEEIVEDFRVNQAEKSTGIEIEYNIPKDFYIELDKFQMTRVLNNLLSNAVKYNDKKPLIKVVVSLKGGSLLVVISDNGIGISKENQKEVFSKFYRCEHNLPKKIKGLGLGLYFVKKIVEAHGGTINLESTPGRGSSFIINLPLNSKEYENTAC